MEKRISLESRGKDPAQVSELNLDNCRTVGEFEGLTTNFVNLTKLSVIKAGLTSFKGFPSKLENLQKLDVSENRISNGLHHIQNCPSLTHLCLSGNKFKELSVLEPLTKLDKLSHLELANTPLSELDEYRTKVFSFLPNLKFLDGQDKDGNEASSSEDEDEGEDGNNGAINGVNNKDVDDEEEDGEGEELEEESEEESEEEEEGPGLAALYSNANLEESDDEDFDEDGVDQEDDDDEVDESDDETNNVESTRGKKRKHEEEETG